MFLSSSFDGHDEEDSVVHDEASADSKSLSYHLPPWLSDSTPDEFIVRACYAYISYFMLIFFN